MLAHCDVKNCIFVVYHVQGAVFTPLLCVSKCALDGRFLFLNRISLLLRVDSCLGTASSIGLARFAALSVVVL